LPLLPMLANMCHFFLSKVALWLPKTTLEELWRKFLLVILD